MSTRTTSHANPSILRCAFAQQMVLARRQRGYSSLVELAITLVVVAFIGLFARGKILQDMDDSAAEATGAYLVAASVGLQRYMILNVAALTQPSPRASLLSPTLADLKGATLDGAPLIAAAFASSSPTGQALRFDITQASPCVGQTCAIVQATVCLTTPLSVRGQVRDDLVTQAMMSMNGMGGRSMTGNGGHINGPTLAIDAVANPVGTTEGILCAVYNTNTFYNLFVRTTESRTLNFSGPLNTTGTVTATGTLDASNGILVLPTATASATCSASGAMGWISSGGSYSPARCNGSTWVTTGGLPVSTAGTTCATAGTLAATAAGATLICQGTTYVDFVSRMGGLVAMEAQIVSNASTVTKPTCAVLSANSAIYLFPMTDVQTNQIVYRSATDNTSYWTISIVDLNGNAIQGDTLAMTYCVY